MRIALLISSLVFCLAGQVPGQARAQDTTLLEIDDLVKVVDKLDSQGTHIDTVTYWTLGCKANLNYSMVTLENWAQGGESSIAFLGTVNTFARYKRDRIRFETTLDASYGIQSLGETGLRKNEDRMDLNMTLGYATTPVLNYSALFNFRSQFTPGYAYPNDSAVVSRFFSPAYIVVSAGLEYKPFPYLKFNLAPLSSKLTLVTSQQLANQGAFGVEPAERDGSGRIVKPGKVFRQETGASFFARFQREVAKNVVIDQKLDLFNGYAQDNPRSRGKVDVNSETSIQLKVNRFLSASIFVQLIYDEDAEVPLYERRGGQRVQVGTGPRTQLKHVSGVGLSMTFEERR